VQEYKISEYTIYMKKRKVLIIDDEEDFGMLMKRFFSQKNYDVYVAYTISDGLKLLDEHLPDIIFLDNNLPDGYGWDKTDYILSTYPQTQLNLISALNVPKTSSSSFRILEKQMLLKELPKMFV
jgi:DNA-binding response OmpR family regulator